MSDEMPLRTQYQLAILADFYGPSARLQRLAGLSDAAVAERFDAIGEDTSIAEILRPAHCRARALLDLVADLDLQADAARDVAAIQQALREMEEWSQ